MNRLSATVKRLKADIPQKNRLRSYDIALATAKGIKTDRT